MNQIYPSPNIELGGTLESAHPKYKYFGDCPFLNSKNIC